MCGITFLILFLGNFLTTVRVIYQKQKQRENKNKELWGTTASCSSYGSTPVKCDCLKYRVAFHLHWPPSILARSPLIMNCQCVCVRGHVNSRTDLCLNDHPINLYRPAEAYIRSAVQCFCCITDSYIGGDTMWLDCGSNVFNCSMSITILISTHTHTHWSVKVRS